MQNSSYSTKISVTASITLPKIFVAIASYRDPECQHTVRDLFAKAAHPERISVGICWQFVPDEDRDCFEIPPPFPNQVRSINVHAAESKGVCWARAHTQTLWRGEEYVLQIDSHMRFEPGWDDLLISMHKQCSPSKKAVLTCYPPAYTQPDTLNRSDIASMKASHFGEDGILLLGGRNIPVKDAPEYPIHGAFCAAGFLFGTSQMIRDVPYDPYLYFYGEENTLALRLWTHGWDMYYPQKLVIYHLYKTSKQERKKTHFADHNNWPVLNKRSIARVLHILGAALSTDKDVIKDIEKYGLGNARSLADYQAWSGVDFKNRLLSEQATSGKAYPPVTQA
jgi:hypothetical protein